jgi:protein-tyrosine phosphatase
VSTTITKLEASTRSTARFAKHLPDRILHSWRRRRLLQDLARLERLGSVLFVCHGNICRSPYAAFSFKRRLPAAVRAHVRVHSAGFIGPDRPSPPEALIVSRRRGIDLSPHVSQLINANTVAGYDLVVVMDRKQAARLRDAHQNIGMVIVLGDLDPRPITRRTITDPFGQSEIVFEESYNRIDRCLDSLIAAVYSFDQ